MLTPTNAGHQTSFFGTDLLLQLDTSDPLIQLSKKIPWSDFDQAFAKHYSKNTGAPSKPIRLTGTIPRYISNGAERSDATKFSSWNNFKDLYDKALTQVPERGGGKVIIEMLN